MSDNGYDVIGDIHGHADALRRLLTKLGYAKIDGVFRHPDRKTIFVGDFVDRGPDQKEVLAIARRMCDARVASAVLGNHEFNAIGWATPDRRGGFLRPHSDKNYKQHKEFLCQYGEGSREYFEAIDWFRSLPVWFEMPGIRVIHACWHTPALSHAFAARLLNRVGPWSNVSCPLWVNSRHMQCNTACPLYPQ